MNSQVASSTTSIASLAAASPPALVDVTSTATESDGHTVLYVISTNANTLSDTTISTIVLSITSSVSTSTSTTTTSQSSTSASDITSSGTVSSSPTSSRTSISSTTKRSTTTASSSGSTPTSTRSPLQSNSSSNTGYIAAIAVLAVLLGITLVALAFLFFRKRRDPKQANTLRSVNDESKFQPEPGAQVAALERQLHEREGQLRASQAALLQQGQSVGGSVLDDRQVNQRFAQVNKSVRDWVVGNFKTTSGNPNLDRDVATLLQRTQPTYRVMLEDPRKRYLVFRSLVAEVLVQAFKSGELLGSPAYSELDSWVKEGGAAHDASEWRIMTVALLEKSPAYRTEHATSVQEISKRIDFMAADLAGHGYSEVRAGQMHKIVNSVATLALDLAKQKSTYTFVNERGVFDPESMEDALQDYSEERLQGKAVQCVVFPAVKKREDGDDKGNRGNVISKAQVLT